jgi:hypothetical protein
MSNGKLTQSVNAPATDFHIVTPSDSALLDQPCRGFLIGVAGNIKLTSLNGTTGIIPVPAGHVSIGALQVWATGTTASGIIALY